MSFLLFSFKFAQLSIRYHCPNKSAIIVVILMRAFHSISDDRVIVDASTSLHLWRYSYYEKPQKNSG